jgi:hypothetical protein
MLNFKDCSLQLEIVMISRLLTQLAPVKILKLLTMEQYRKKDMSVYVYKLYLCLSSCIHTHAYIQRELNKANW